MLTASLAVSLLALSASLDLPLLPLDPPSAALAQEGDAPPPPPPGVDAPPAVDEPPPAPPTGVEEAPPPPPALTPPDGARVAPAEPDSAGPRARMNERRKKKQAKDDGLDPMLTTAVQIGVGTLTCGVCSLASCGAAFGIGLLTLPLASLAIPLLVTAITSVRDLILCSAVGATVGGVEGLTGNLIGQEEADLLWPTLAGAGIGAGVGGTFLIANFILAAMNLGSPPPPSPGQTPNPTQLLTSNPIASAVSLGACGVCVVGCLALPIVPAVVYSMTAQPKAESASVALLEQPPTQDTSRTAMAY